MKHRCLTIGTLLGMGILLAAGVAAATQERAQLPQQPARKPQGPLISLERAYDLALASDQQIRIAYWEVRKANLLPWSALARTMGTQINASGNLGHDENTSRNDFIFGTRLTNGTRTDSGRIGLVATQPLIDATVFPAYKIGKLSARSARLEHQFTVRGVLFSVAKAFYQVLNQQRIVEVNHQALELSAEQLDYAQKREAVGEVTRSDELRARVSLEAARRSLIESENQLLANRNLLANILGLQNDQFELCEPSDYAASSEPFEKLLATAYERREDLRVAELAIEQDQQRHNVVIAQYYPSLAAQWNGALSESHSATDRSVDNWAATLSVQVPIFNGGQRELEMISTREQISQTRLRKELLARQIQEDAKEAWLTTRSLRETLKALALQVEAAEQSYKDLDSQYRAGSATSLEVLTALNGLNASRRDLSIQTYAYQIALRGLEQVSGVFQQKRVEGVKIR